MHSQVEHAVKAAEALGNAASMHSSLGVFGPFGEWLGWPEWYLDGTTINLRDGVPATNSVRDGLIMNANILAHGKAGLLIDRTLDCKRLVTGPDAALIVRNAPTLREASRSLALLLSLSTPCFKVRRTVKDNDVLIEIVEQVPTGEILGFHSAIRMILFIRMIERFLIEDLWQCRLCLTLERHEAGARLEPGLRARVEFGAPSNRLFYPAHWEQKRNFDYELSLWRLALAELRLLEQRLDEADYSHKLRHHVSSMIERENRVPRLKEIAEIENISIRTMNRKLSEAGVKYQDVVDDVRHSLISRLILDPTMTLGDVAHSAGYSNVSGFSRSFKEWFGESPAQYRRRLQQGR